MSTAAMSAPLVEATSATGLIGKRRYAPPTAALANGAAGHALDYDDQHDPARAIVDAFPESSCIRSL